MDTDSPEDAPLPPLQIHLSSSSPGYSVPIRAPVTVDSDSEFGLFINGRNYSRTSSFNSSSSIGISSYGDEHTSVFEEEHDGFVAYPDDEIVIESSHVEESCFRRHFVRYTDANHVKESCSYSEATIFRPFVKISCEENSDAADFGTKLCMPIARLTRDSDSVSVSDSDSNSLDGCRSDGVVQKVTMAPKVRSFDGDEGDGDDNDHVDDELQDEGVFSGYDIYSVDGCRSDGYGWIPADGVVQKVTMAPKVRSFNGDEGDDDDDDITGIENLNSELTRNEDAKLSESDVLSFDLERIDSQTVFSSNNETETSNGDEADDVLQVECVFSDVDITGIEILNSVSTESTENKACKGECLNEAVKLFESDASSFNLERIVAQTVLTSNNETETDTVNVQLSESDEASFNSERFDAQFISNSESEIEFSKSVSTELIENDLERIDVKLSESNEPSFDSEIPDAQIIPNSNSEIKIKTLNETKQEFAIKNEEMLTKMQRVRAKFLRLALNKQLTTNVNGEGGNYNFDFSLTVLAIGKTGVGKSATINSIFGEKKAITHAFDPGTTTIQEITGDVDGIQLRLIDTPGLKRSSSDRSYNLKILKSIKRFTRKYTPNVVLYVDRLDTRDTNDSHILTLITSSLGSSLWHSCIIALTHAICESCDPLTEPSKGFMVQRCRSIQEQIVRCGGNTRLVANPVWLVDNCMSYEHEIMDLGCGLKGLACLDQANEDDGCDQGSTSEHVNKPQEANNLSMERNKGYFMEDAYRVKLLGYNHWTIGCRLFI
ncbi:hypothetical protein R6Q57_006645 [Mikania cordata]